ncbi:MAG: mechanosensitive ion channel family protein [Xanthobacteraceae bacterium]|nr:mechanosensitive ion channel family protein [Xanthobacteraceae bacterium]
MIEMLQGGYSAATEILHLVPNWLIITALLSVSMIAALLVHALIVGLMRRTFGARHPRLRTLLTNSKGPLRLGLIVLAMSLAVRVTPLSEATATIVGNVLNVAFIALLGWIAATAVQISSQVYLLRFRLDTEDNLLARKHVTQVRILKRAVDVLIFVMTLAAALMTFDQVRQYGVSLFASAGVAGLAIGLAARPLLSNLIAGIQIATAQPIRLDDVVVVESEWGTIEEITTTYVVIKLWDWRRLVVPLSYFIEKPFQNWTRETSALIGSVFLYVDYTAPIDKLRDRLNEIVRASGLWDGQVAVLQVSDAKDSTMELRALVSARSAPTSWDLRCEVREQLITYLREHYPDALPHSRQLLSAEGGRGTVAASPGLVPRQMPEDAEKVSH